MARSFKHILFSALIGLLSLVMIACAAPAPAPAEEEPAAEEDMAEEEPMEEEVMEEDMAEEEEAMEDDMAEESAGGFALSQDIAARVEAGETPRIIVSYHDVSNEFAPQIRAGVERANEELDVNAEFVGPVGADADAQIAELESLVETGVDGIAISSVSTDALAPVIDRFIKQGIPVVAYNTDNPDSLRLAFVGQDLEQSGYEAGQILAELLGGEGDVLIFTLDAAAQWSIDRETGARRAFEEYEGINVVETINTGTEPQAMFSAIENAALANPDIDGYLSLECCSNPAAGEYLEREGLTDTVTLVGFDLLPQTLELVQSGAVDATIGQAPERQSFEAVRLLLEVLQGNEISDVDTGIEIVDGENIGDYVE